MTDNMANNTTLQHLDHLAAKGSYRVVLLTGQPPVLPDLESRLKQDGYRVETRRGRDFLAVSEQEGEAAAIAQAGATLQQIATNSKPNFLLLDYGRQQELDMLVQSAETLDVEAPLCVYSVPDNLRKESDAYQGIVKAINIRRALGVMSYQADQFAEQVQQTQEEDMIETVLEQFDTVYGLLLALREDQASEQISDELKRQLVGADLTVAGFELMNPLAATDPLLQEYKTRLGLAYAVLYNSPMLTEDEAYSVKAAIGKQVEALKAASRSASPTLPRKQKPRAGRIVYGETYPGNAVVMVIRQPTLGKPAYHLFIDLKESFGPRQPPSPDHVFVLNDLSRNELDDLLIGMSSSIAHVSEYDLTGEHAGNPQEMAKRMASIGFGNYSYAERQRLHPTRPRDIKKNAH